jgi:excisionase family DNA binding protein
MYGNGCRFMSDESRPSNVGSSSGSASSGHGGVTPLNGAGAPNGRFFTVAEVAATVRLSKMSVYRLIHSGQLEAVQFGRSFRVPERALNAYLDGSYYNAG